MLANRLLAIENDEVKTEVNEPDTNPEKSDETCDREEHYKTKERTHTSTEKNETRYITLRNAGVEQTL